MVASALCFWGLQQVVRLVCVWGVITVCAPPVCACGCVDHNGRAFLGRRHRCEGVEGGLLRVLKLH